MHVLIRHYYKRKKETSAQFLHIGSLIESSPGVGLQGRVDVAESGRVFDVPLVGSLQAFLPADLLPPAQLEEALGVDVVAEIVEDAIFDECHHVLRAALISRELHLRIRIFFKKKTF